ncbi:MAG: hypothetical protein ACLR6B_08315 [Blautia sp.]
MRRSNTAKFLSRDDIRQRTAVNAKNCGTSGGNGTLGRSAGIQSAIYL